MYDVVQSEGRLILREWSAPWARVVATIVGAVAVYVCVGIFLVSDPRSVLWPIPSWLARLLVMTATSVGAMSFVWGVFSLDRTLTFDGVRRSLVVVEKRPFGRARIVTRSLSDIASVDVVSEFGDQDDTFHVHLVVHGEKRPVVVREDLERSEADALTARLRDLLKV